MTALTKVYNRRAYDAQIRKALDALKKGRSSKIFPSSFSISTISRISITTTATGPVTKSCPTWPRIIKSLLRKEDFVARYGGDEFAIILPEVDLKGAGKIAEKIRTGVYDVEFKIYKEHDLTVQVSLSMGVSQGRETDDPGSVFQRADKAMYLAKEKGRNRVMNEKDVHA